MTNPLLTPFELPPFSKILPEHVVPAVTKALNDCRENVERVVAQGAPYTWENLCHKVRVLRALEHYRATGKRLSEQKADSLPPERPYRSLVLGLDFPDRAALYRRIDLRVDKMLEAGLLAEAEYVWHNREAFRTAAQAIGYKEFFPYFQQTATLEVCTEKLKQASRNYAKRQLTWFRHMDGVTWLDAGAADVRQTALRLTQDFLLKG